MSYKEKIQEEIKKALNGQVNNVSLERTKAKEHGDVATNIAMVLAKELRKDPIQVATEIKQKFNLDTKLISHIEVAKPGFINFVVNEYALAESLSEIFEKGKTYGLSPKKSKGKVLIEFVSANPTGDLHIGHGRQAVIGDILTNLLEAIGYEVTKEFYINDFGEQIQNLSETCNAISKRLKGETVEWKDEFYPEETIAPYMKRALKEKKPNVTKESLTEEVKDLIIKTQKELLSSFGINFHNWFSESNLHKTKAIDDVLSKLKAKQVTYEQEGAIWFKAKEFNDVRDRVLIRSDGRPTYLLADIAYHVDKFKRGNDLLITVWGADHHGQEVSLKGGLKALTYDDKKLEIVFVQLVSLKIEDKAVKMSKRGGAIINIEDVLNETGRDAFRYFLAETHPNNKMVFDINLAKKQDKENPVYYIQYAHARCCSIFRQIDKDITAFKTNKELLIKLFETNNQEYTATKDLLLRVLDFPEEVNNAASSRAPNRIANYLKDLARDFHQFYTVCRVISKDTPLTNARLALVDACKIVISNGLKILGIQAPEAM